MDFKNIRYASNDEIEIKNRIRKLMSESPIPDNEVLANLGLFLTRGALSRILFFHELYKHIINVHGVIVEFGTRWGQNLSLFESFRAIYEPYNFTRKIIGFDTFEGFCEVDVKDGVYGGVEKGAYAVTKNYEDYLKELLKCHEQINPMAHKQKINIIKGDAGEKIHEYLNENRETIIALAYFDMDVYKPTRECLKAISSSLVRGSVIGFDELNCSEFPGEAEAIKEVLGLRNCKLVRLPMAPLQSYIIVE